MDFSVVVPVYNNSHSLERTYKNIRACFSTFNHNYQIVFVDDNSTDSSFDVLLRLKEQDSNIAIVQLERNCGQSVAIYAGLHYATGKYITVISADLQEEETFIEKLISAAEKFPDADFIVGYRNRNSDYLIFKILSRLFYKIIQLKIPQMPSGGFDTGMGTAEVVKKYIENYHKDIFIQAAFLRLAKKVEHVEYHRKKSAADALRLQSILFKFNYFIICIWSVYLGGGKKNTLRKEEVYSVKKYLP